MKKSLAEVTRDAKQLTPRQQMKLVSRLLSVEETADALKPANEVTKAWNQEITRRIAEYRAGKAVFIPCSEVKREIEKTLAKINLQLDFGV